MVKLGGFGVSVYPNAGLKDGGYVYMKNGTQYNLRLENSDRTLRAAAEVKIDGKGVGTFVVPPALIYNGVTQIERSVYSRGIFTFFAEGTQEFNDVEGNLVTPEKRGLIEVVFKKELYRPPQNLPYYTFLDMTSRGERAVGKLSAEAVAGVTGETGESLQSFTPTQMEVDENSAVTIYLRLIPAPAARPLYKGIVSEYPKPLTK